MKWSLQKALNLSDEEVRDALIRASRIEEKYQPDGAVSYIPEIEAGALFQAVRDGLIVKSNNPMVNAVYSVYHAAAVGRVLDIQPVEVEYENPS